jgi:DinB superfamily
MQLTRKVQEVMDQLSTQRQALLDATSGLTETQLAFKPQGTAWSISDILHHLALTDEANAKLAANMLKQAREKKLLQDPTPEASVLDSLDGFKERLSGGNFQAPERVAPRSHLPAIESIHRLKGSRARITDAVEQLSGYDLTALAYPHPLLGDLNGYQWLIIAGQHESRHTAQIARIKKDLNFPA